MLWSWTGKWLFEVIRFVAHVVPGNSGLFIESFQPEGVGARSHLRTDPMHLGHPSATVKLSTAPGGHYEVDLLNRSVDSHDIDVSAVGGLGF